MPRMTDAGRPGLSLALTLAALLVATAAASEPLAQVTGGVLAGIDQPGGGASFLGVPFAAPPVGPLRWRPPQPPHRWSGTRLATQEPPACPQSLYGDWNAEAAASGAEDCLYLDLRTPRLDPDARLPVMVWIYGGGNRAGSARGTVNSRLVEKGVVLVAIQYRLAALGFLAHPALSVENTLHASGEYGLMDQIAALRWVHDNIARFGGDPDNVTIFGESAGAQDVGRLLVAPQARGLFAKAIEESGAPDFGLPVLSLAEAEQRGAVIAHRAGAPVNATAAQLRALPVAALLQAPEADHGPIPGLKDASFVWLQTVIDGRVLPKSPQAVLTEAEQAPRPLIIGSNSRELSLAWSDPREAIGALFGDQAEAAFRLYGLNGAQPPPADPRLGDVGAQIAADTTFRCPSSQLAASMVRAGAPVWSYLYDRSPTHGPVSHNVELASVFGDQPVSSPADPRPYALVDYWVAFARNGDPNAPGLAAWPRQTRQTRPYLLFSDAGPLVRTDLRAPFCALLNAY